MILVTTFLWIHIVILILGTAYKIVRPAPDEDLRFAVIVATYNAILILSLGVLLLGV